MTMTVDAKARIRMQWTAAADAWDRVFAWYSAAFRPVMDWCCSATELRTGMRVLDVACGSGQPAFMAAERVGAGGRVVGIDFSPRMVELANRRARAGGFDQLEFREMDAETLVFDDASFDAVTCTCGLMFFPDADRALSEMHRVLRPGGRAAVAVWDDPGRSSFLTAGGAAVAQFFPPTPPNPRFPGGFRFSAPGALEGLVRNAGFLDLRVESVPMPIDFKSADEYWDVFTETAAGIKDKIDALSAGDRARLTAIVKESVSRHPHEGGFRLYATPLCAVGQK